MKAAQARTVADPHPHFIRLRAATAEDKQSLVVILDAALTLWLCEQPDDVLARQAQQVVRTMLPARQARPALALAPNVVYVAPERWHHQEVAP